MLGAPATLVPHNNAPNWLLQRTGLRLPSRICGEQPIAFLAQQKAGSTSVRTMSSVATGKELRVVRNGKCICDHAAGKGSLGLTSFSDDAPWCLSCPGMGWFTIWREPFARVLSAFVFCRFHVYPFPHGDPLCLNGEPDGARMDVCSFARRWGSYQLAKLVHLPLGAEELSAVLPAHATCLANQSLRLDTRIGMISAIHRQIHVMRACGLDDGRTAAGRQLIDNVKDTMSRAFRIIGLVERWNESMALFAVASGCDAWLTPRAQENVGGYVHDYVHIPKNRRHSSHRTAAVLRRRRKVSVASEEGARDDAKLLTAAANKELAACRPLLEPLFAADVELYTEAQRIFELQMATARQGDAVGSA